MRGATRRTRIQRRLLGAGGFAATAALAVFHGQLLWQRLSDGSLLQPIVVTRWVASALLILVLLRLWSRGLPLLRGRRAGILWMLVVLLHAMAPGGAVPAVGPAAEGMLPVALAMAAFLACAVAWAPRRGQTAARRPASRCRQRSRRPSSGWYRALFSRPPPLPLHS